MQKSLVVFESKYGSTRQYAEWIGEALGADVKRASEVRPESLAAYDAVVFGGYLYVGKIVGAEFVTRNWPALEKKKVVVFSSSGSPPGDPALTAAFEAAFSPAIRARVKYFPLPGRRGRLDLKDSLLMLFPRAMLYLAWLSKRDEKSRKEFDGMSRQFDRVDKAAIAPLVREIKG